MRLHVVSAFLFAVGASLKNRVTNWARKLRQPRYLIGSILVAVYFWSFFWNPLRTGVGAGAITRVGSAENARGMAIALAFLQIIGSWIAGPFGQGIVFAENEVLLLFPAPLARRELLLYRWLKELPPSIFFAAIFSIILKRVGAPSFGVTFVTLFLMNNILAAHGTAARLLCLWIKNRGGLWRILLPIPALMLVGFLVWAISEVYSDIRHLDASVAPTTRLASATAFKTALLPIDWLTHPIVYSSFRKAASALALLAGLLIIARRIVGSLDIAFEEQSTVVAARLARLRAGGVDALKEPEKLVIKPTSKPIFSLSPIGPPWTAFVWKNIISIGRFKRALMFIIPTTIMIAFVYSSMHKSKSGDIGAIIAVVIVMIMPYMSLAGPAMLRIDLRLDLLHFDVLKALPVRGRQLILGEILATASTIWAIQLFLLGIAVAVTPNFGEYGKTTSLMLAVFFGGGALLGGLNFTVTTGQNLLALYFPSFIRLGNGHRAGFDAFGQQLIGALLSFFGFFVLLLLPGLLGAGAGFLGYLLMDKPGVALFGGIVAGIALAVQAWILICASEKRYETFDLSQETMANE